MRNFNGLCILFSLVACGSGGASESEDGFFPKVSIGRPMPTPPLPESISVVSVFKDLSGGAGQPDSDANE